MGSTQDNGAEEKKRRAENVEDVRFVFINLFFLRNSFPAPFFTYARAHGLKLLYGIVNALHAFYAQVALPPNVGGLVSARERRVRLGEGAIEHE